MTHNKRNNSISLDWNDGQVRGLSKADEEYINRLGDSDNWTPTKPTRRDITTAEDMNVWRAYKKQQYANKKARK